jgi:hypothetical protein
MDSLIKLYSLVKKEKKKERFDIILEPLQAITQLALLSYCPKGSKLTISHNLLSIQTPTWVQGLWRTYNQDNRDDLFFLFNAIVRFNSFYMYLKKESAEYCGLFDLLVQLSKRGIDKLLQTYSNTEQPALLHTLHLYRTLLDKPELFVDEVASGAGKSSEGTGKSSEGTGGAGTGKRARSVEGMASTSMSTASMSTASMSTASMGEHSKHSIDEVFVKIRTLYTSREFIILYQVLLTIEIHPENYEIYIQGLQVLFTPVCDKIQKWITDNIVY